MYSVQCTCKYSILYHSAESPKYSPFVSPMIKWNPVKLNMVTLKAGFHMIAMITAITTIADKKVGWLLWSYGNNFLAIVEIIAIIALIWKPLSRDYSDHYDHTETTLQRL